jgi:hypothetical protein
MPKRFSLPDLGFTKKSRERIKKKMEDVEKEIITLTNKINDKIKRTNAILNAKRDGYNIPLLTLDNNLSIEELKSKDTDMYNLLDFHERRRVGYTGYNLMYIKETDTYVAFPNVPITKPKSNSKTKKGGKRKKNKTKRRRKCN